MKGSPPAELVEIQNSVPPFPYLWDWFVSLANSRQSGLAANPITEQEIRAFCENRSMRMCVFEIEAIKRLDRISLTDFSKE
jgi:hypothetical protein